MMADLHQLALYAYAATIFAALVAEFCPVRRVALPSAVASIAFSLIAGGSWCYTVYKQRYVFENSEFPARSAKRAPKERTDQGGGGEGGGAQAQAGAGQGGGGGEPEDLEDGGSDGASGGGVSGVVADVNRGVQSGADALLDQILPNRKWRNPENAGRDIEGDIVRDCPSCPDMVIVAGGTQMIGASATDPAATEAERPQREARFWPGFAMSRNPISASDLAAFRTDAGLATPSCAGPAGRPATQSATCLYPNEADRYAAWLTARTGKRFRLPSAVEWEFAARTAGVTRLANTGTGAISAPLDGIGQDLAEFTSDCWTPYIPSAGNERRVWSSNVLACYELVLKGARPGEDLVHQRFSARRPIDIGKPDWGTGFRVVRDAK